MNGSGRVARMVVGGLLGSWFVATALSQDPFRKFPGARRYDPSGAVVPDWRFFAPRPGMHDYHLLFRDELPDDSVTEWREILPVEQRVPRHFVWYANRRAEKVLGDSVVGIIGFSKEADRKKEDIQLSISYLTLLNYLTYQEKHHPDAKRTQFLIAASAGYDETEEPMMMFLSNLHPLS
ncbi:hypothetical protein [Amycolatopsis plumensis]|uniref:Uncharacterized protein n=1 Tax=Amycolatopsis plumensis TaxID=236508 RepID=A0ABV5UA86_9PSEU